MRADPLAQDRDATSRRWPVAVAAAVSSLLMLAASSAVSATSVQGGAGLLVIGHRGASYNAPENTFAAWDLALEANADFLELDLQMTSDGELVVMHDEKLDRTARGPRPDCQGVIRTKTLQQLGRCEAGSWFNSKHRDRRNDDFIGLRIPTLAAVFERYGPRARYYIETKDPEAAPGMEEEVLRLIDQYGVFAADSEQPGVVIQSFHPQSLRRIHALDSRIPLSQLVAKRESSRSIRARLAQIATYARGIGPERGDVDAELVQAAHAAGLGVFPYTVNDAAEMRHLVELGVDGIFTDRPDLLRQILDG